jgi:integrase
MAIYKRKDDRSDCYYIDFIAASGQRIRKTSGTRDQRQAQELHDKLKAQSWRVTNLNKTPDYFWEDAVIRWLNEQSHKKSLKDDKVHLRWLHQYLHGMKLNEISKSVVEVVKQKKIESGVTNATVNRVLAVVRGILNRAVKEWEWLDKAPHVRLLHEAVNRVRWLTHAEADRLIDELPAHLADMMIFTLSTGLRERNVTRLEWSQVNMHQRQAWIHSDQSKSKKAIAVPLNDDALAVLRRQIGKHETRVFTYKGNAVDIANTRAWRNALVRANIKDFRWHDLRHTWASWHAQNGTPLHALQELGGWSDGEMVKRYAHLSHQHPAGYAANLHQRDETENNARGGIMSHPQKSPNDQKAVRA